MDVKQLIQLQRKIEKAVWDFDDKMRAYFPPEAFQRLIWESHPQGFVFEWMGMQPVFEQFLKDKYPDVSAELEAAFKSFEELS
ncbi:hypothetical protein ACFPVS_12060 [Neisseria weixii]|uniref:hypothetical protein n=1 Tax=Neisseria weixii TaxID=1853276 RepID=UPI000BB74755|nr:hypothetical protein [Neisseria weixii]ATD64867.1 hypothetical protein CGZ65_05260 [Neisseria weixii]